VTELTAPVRWWARRLLIILTLTAMAAACTGGDGWPGQKQPPDDSSQASNSYTGPPLRGIQNPLGLKWDWTRVSQYVPFLRRLSGGATFYELVWCDVEPYRGRLYWSRVDDVARSSRRLGYSLSLKIRVGGSCWATGGRGGHARGGEAGSKRKTASAMPVNLAAYQTFVCTVVQRYSAMKIRQYAIENEADAPFFWEGTPEEYEQLVKVAAATIRSVDPTAQILDGGLTSATYGVAIADQLLAQGRAMAAITSYQRYYRRFHTEDVPSVNGLNELQVALADYRVRRSLDFLAATRRLVTERIVDAYQLHFYEPWDNLPDVLSYLREILPPGFPIEAWEVGSFWPEGPNDQQERAVEATKVVATLLGGGVRQVTWLPLAYNPNALRSEIRWGLLNPDGTIRPAGEAVARLAQATRGASWRAISIDAITGLALSDRRRSTLVLWSDRGTDLASLEAQTRVTTMSGRQLPSRAASLHLSSEPIFVTMPGGLGSALRLLARAAST
jgi:hypothetical protein